MVEYSKIAYKKWGLPLSFRATAFVFHFLFFVISLLNLWWLSILSTPILITLLVSALIWWLRPSSESTQSADREKTLIGIGAALLGIFYCAILPSFALLLLTKESSGLEWFGFLLVVVFSGDILAYFAGNFFGKHKLLPVASPNKTIEGAVGGLIGSALCGTVYAQFFLVTNSLFYMAIISTLAAILAQCGDLFESLVKRVADVKDSGRIMPGHGGVLDRLDGVYFAAPLVYAASQWPILL